MPNFKAFRVIDGHIPVDISDVSVGGQRDTACVGWAGNCKVRYAQVGDATTRVVQKLAMYVDHSLLNIGVVFWMRLKTFGPPDRQDGPSVESASPSLE